MAEQTISHQLLQQRIRNGIIDYLELAASAEEQRDYERSVPIAHVPHEMINMWEYQVNGDNLDWYGQPVFSKDENNAIRAFQGVWSAVADATPNPMPSKITALLGTPVWNRLMVAAHQALEVFRVRGRFDEEVEHQFKT